MVQNTSVEQQNDFNRFRVDFGTILVTKTSTNRLKIDFGKRCEFINKTEALVPTGTRPDLDEGGAQSLSNRLKKGLVLLY